MNNINRVVITGNLTADPELRSTAERHRGLQPADRLQHPPQGRRGSGSTSPTTSTSPSGARRARTSPGTSPRAARSRSTGAWSGASGRPRTASKRQAVDIIADSVQFLNSGNGNGASSEDGGRARGGGRRRRGGHPVLGPSGPRPDRGAGHQPRRRGATMSQNLLIDQILEDLRRARRAAARAVADDPCPAGRGDAPRRADPRAVLGVGRTPPRAGAAAQRRVRVPRRVHPRRSASEREPGSPPRICSPTCGCWRATRSAPVL